MTIQKHVRPAALISAVALAALPFSKTHAYDFEVGDTTASVYGYAKLDIFYDVDDDLGLTSFRGAAARLDIEEDEGSDGHFSMQTIESRFGFKTSSPVGGSTLTTVIEGDFFGDAGSGGFRLRHAYGQWNGILAGQTWSNFGSGVAVTPLLDFAGTSGHAIAHRQPQVRYTDGNFSFSIEDPDDKGGVVDAVGEKSKAPDVTVRYTDRSGSFKYSASALGRYLEFDDAGMASSASSDSSVAWGAALEASMDITQALTIRGGITYGDGIGGYINGNVNIKPGFADTDGSLETVRTAGGSLGASLKAGPGAINLAYSRVANDFEDNPAFLTENEKLHEAWANYIWSPAERISYGIEAGWHQREQTDGEKGDALRLQGMLKYDF